MKLKVILLILYLCSFINLTAQLPEEEIVYRVARDHMNNYFPGDAKEIISIDTLLYDNEPVIFVVNLKDGGWILVSGDKKVIPVLGFNYKGRFTKLDRGKNIACYEWITSYSKQIKEIRKEKGMQVHEGWFSDATASKGTDSEVVVVEPLVKTLWNQGAGWNRFCPEDSLGPGGHTYVGCVAVAMAQALSVYQVPDTGTYTNKYDCDDYGIIEVKFKETHYKWDSMSLDKPDDYNALLLFHCAVAVNMNFGPDGSSANTKLSRSAIGRYFKMSKKCTYLYKANTEEDEWEEIIINNLALGRPIIYSGNADDGKAGHAFNIDGVNGEGSKGPNYFHVNWGWGGSRNGYYLINDLKPGNRVYSKNNKAVFKIQPYYYPTDVIVGDTLIPTGIAAGSAITPLEVIDEAYDNQYEIIFLCDSAYINDKWVSDYYLQNDSIITGRVFTDDDIGKDTLTFFVTDKYGNYIEDDVVLTIAKFTGTAALPINDNRTHEFKIFPNPASGIININSNNEFPIDHFRIYSQSGIMIREFNHPPALARINTGGFEKGFYIFEIRYADGFIARRKVLIF
ncbi:MAG: C10 family peptidase [Bacteroidota bacterium]|nr:C10 family peptidase [Bacteroidota bacterium]